jgi:hypothetical protein
VIWKGVWPLRFRPEEGMEVIATGKLTTFPGSSKYQIVIEALEPAGVGALMALIEERKRKLGAEGVFDEAASSCCPMAAARDRRRDVADRRGHSRHPASPRRPFPCPGAGLAGQGAGRNVGREVAAAIAWLQCAAGGRRHSAARTC